MTTLSIGPLAVPLGALPWIAALIAALLVIARRRRDGHRDAEPLLIGAALAALAGARLAFVVRYWDQYDGLFAMLDLRDGGLWWPGALIGAIAGLGLAVARGHRPALGEAGRAALAGALVAVPVAAVVMILGPRDSLAPEVTLYQPDGTAVSLEQARGEGVTLVNLWASWCPPCRREMPVLEEGQRRYSQARFLFANQGESAATIQGYLAEANLNLEGIYLDPHSDLSRALGGGALPTTLIINAQGQIVDHHLGPLSRAGLSHLLAPHLKE